MYVCIDIKKLQNLKLRKKSRPFMTPYYFSVTSMIERKSLPVHTYVYIYVNPTMERNKKKKKP